MSPKLLNADSNTQLPVHYISKFSNAKVLINPVEKAAVNGSESPDQREKRADLKQITPQLFLGKKAELARHESKYFTRNKVNVIKSAVGGMGPVQ